MVRRMHKSFISEEAAGPGAIRADVSQGLETSERYEEAERNSGQHTNLARQSFLTSLMPELRHMTFGPL